ncbi:hypothetical protein [Candidatus Kuenenia stuttgartiensis]|uniref:hypothetical protein n=1 Tax=Kuenenia stuttgartiensis TaxID=174633 RepID=UPI00146E5407|nr:hypothetical protein [Candidatus Kuenenia stuttgartiensis]
MAVKNYRFISKGTVVSDEREKNSKSKKEVGMGEGNITYLTPDAEFRVLLSLPER